MRCRLARFDYVEGPPLVYFTFFTSNELYLHKTNTEKADELYKAKRGSMLTPPTLLNKNWPELVPKEFVIDNSNGTWDRAHVDIVLSGLGWISCTQRGTIRGSAPNSSLSRKTICLFVFLLANEKSIVPLQFAFGTRRTATFRQESR
jgi:ribosome biogenesis GTPase A